MESLVYIALFAPFVGSLFAGLFFARSPKSILVGVVNPALIGVSFLASVALAMHVAEFGAVHVTMMDWISMGGLNIPFGFLVDEVSVTMMLVVTLVSTVVHIYSNGYMDHDKSFNRFFAYLSAFVFSMMILVMSDNLAGLFIGWEGVGVCSWLLIGFWYHKEDKPFEENPSISPSWAANEAFIMNRIADLGMLVGIFLIYWNVGSLQYNVVFDALPNLADGLLVGIAIALFIGAMGKSAQFPLHTWLTDAMEGPTPVSALIHAATMVTAGVFLVIRMSPLYSMEAVSGVSMFIAALGTFVAFYAASMALIARDIKRIVALSTLSQLGYMFAAAGLGAYWIALFHLAAHAFFKALLFLGAGNVMHAMDDELDIFKMGGLRKVMMGSYIYMGIASIALAGLPFFAGFYSKDAIIETAFNEGTYLIWIMLVITAGMTAFYSFRQVFFSFHGEERWKPLGFNPHDMYKYVLVAMAPLAILAISFGWFMDGYKAFITKNLPAYEMSDHTHHIAWLLGALVVLFAVIGIWIAYRKYAGKGAMAWQRDEKVENSFIYKLLENQYYVPHAYDRFIVQPYIVASDKFWEWDNKIVDGTVDTIAKTIYDAGDKSRTMQTGNLSTYLNWMGAGALLLIVAAAISAVIG
ncbi:NADH-quinone oxidoreductase subunit L [Sulfurovum sp. bin170]|uniref:NADH-quinone oxidoreductase subunit L n=1 Tax=Sulfurovum sp. bin170 TaxID=2695268 RepID=UPI0013DF48BE|nr:NADH-quinone oxidoreductase subunit L [Sulfurovum sp. bin170]NEW60083.1 NADH-quinone oxidoreductase subunit L [Sulfurovum sp. bin170]